MKKYLVIFQDEFNNLYLLGKYDDLKDAVPDVNDYLEQYNTKIDEITEYPSTFEMAFDMEIENPEEEHIMVRGFIIYE